MFSNYISLERKVMTALNVIDSDLPTIYGYVSDFLNLSYYRNQDQACIVTSNAGSRESINGAFYQTSNITVFIGERVLLNQEDLRFSFLDEIERASKTQLLLQHYIEYNEYFNSDELISVKNENIPLYNSNIQLAGETVTYTIKQRINCN